MTGTRYRGMLEPIGLTGTIEAIYLTLATAPSATNEDLVRLVEVPEAVVRSALEFLETQGLVTRTPGRQVRYVAAPPDVALDGVIARKQESLRNLRNELTDLVEDYRAARGRSAAELVEVVTGPTAITLRFEQLQASAEHEVATMTRPPVLDVNNDAAMSAMARGVVYRTVYDREALSTPGLLAAAARHAEAGEQARACAGLPVKLAIFDRRVVLVPVVREAESLATGAVVVHGSGLLEALVALFDTYWAMGTPLRFDRARAHLPAERDGRPDPDDLRLLSLLLAGMTDGAIAAQLGISTRTVWRRLRALMASVGAETRVQLAYETARQCWLE